MTKELKSIDVLEMRLKEKKGWGEAVCTTIRDASKVQQVRTDDFHKNTIMKLLAFLDANTTVTPENLEQYKIHEKLALNAVKDAETTYKEYVKNDLGEFVKYRT